MQTTHDTSASPPMTSIVRIAVIVVTLALFLGSTLNAVTGQRDLAVLFALATPLGISAWGFARAGHNEAAVVLLCCVLITVVTLVLVLNPLGVNNIAVTAYGGVMLFGALLLSRRALVITGVFAVLGRYGTEVLFGSLGDAHRATVDDPVTGLLNRPGFLEQADRRLKAARGGDGCCALVLADLDGFRRVNVVIGHRAGDGVLKETAGRLTRLAQAHLRGRIGDDEFALLAMGLSDEAAAEAFARSVHEALQFEFAGVSVRASVGFARSPRDANGVEALLLAAEGSLTRAKDHENESERFAAPADRI